MEGVQVGRRVKSSRAQVVGSFPLVKLALFDLT